MARLNITVPDALYARLEQLRDRINLSKVCATALEKEVMMLEGQPSITDPRIAQLLQRLQSTRERWHQRGYEDGINWAVELATRDEIQGVATHLAEQGGQQLAGLFQTQGGFAMAMRATSSTQPFPPHFPPQRPSVGGHSASVPAFHPPEISLQAAGPAHPPMPPEPPMPIMGNVSHNVVFHRAGLPFPGFPESFHPMERLQYWQEQDHAKSGGQGGRLEVDEGAYLEGWRDAVKGIWQTISPALS